MLAGGEGFYFLCITLYYMGIVSLRLDSKFEKLIQRDLKDFNYAGKTEYIRQAIRELHEKLRAERAIAALAKNKGFAKRAGIKGPTEEEYERIREEVGREYLKKLKSPRAGQP